MDNIKTWSGILVEEWIRTSEWRNVQCVVNPWMKDDEQEIGPTMWLITGAV